MKEAQSEKRMTNEHRATDAANWCAVCGAHVSFPHEHFNPDYNERHMSSNLSCAAGGVPHLSVVHKAGCPICNPTKTVPELNAAVAALNDPTGWREFIENVIDGKNYFRAAEYMKLLEQFEKVTRERDEALAKTSANETTEQLGLQVALGRVKAALIYACFAQHKTPQYMLPKGITLINGDAVEVTVDGVKVYAGPDRSAQEPSEKPWTTGGNPEGTHRQGYAHFAYTRVVEVFGEPRYMGDNQDGRVVFEWVVTFKDGTVATIYDYKQSQLYGDDPDAPTPDEMKTLPRFEWHIGGKSQRAVELVTSALNGFGDQCT